VKPRAKEDHEQNRIEHEGDSGGDVDDAHEQIVPAPPHEAGKPPVEDADDTARRRGDNADEEGDPSAHHDADEEVATVGIRSEPVFGAGKLVGPVQILLPVGVTRQERPEKGKGENEGQQHEAEEGRRVAAKAPPGVLEVGEAGASDALSLLFRGGKGLPERERKLVGSGRKAERGRRGGEGHGGRSPHFPTLIRGSRKP